MSGVGKRKNRLRFDTRRPNIQRLRGGQTTPLLPSWCGVGHVTLLVLSFFLFPGNSFFLKFSIPFHSCYFPLSFTSSLSALTNQIPVIFLNLEYERQLNDSAISDQRPVKVASEEVRSRKAPFLLFREASPSSEEVRSRKAPFLFFRKASSSAGEYITAVPVACNNPFL